MTEKLTFKGMVGFDGKNKNGLLIHPNNKHFIYSVGSSLILESIVEKKQVFLSQHNNTVSCLAVSKCGKFIASGDKTHRGFKSELIIWDFEKMCEYYRFETPHQEMMMAVNFSCNASYLATLGGHDDGKIIIWDIAKKLPICGEAAQMDNAGICNVVRFLNNDENRFITAGDHTLRVWTLDRLGRKVKPNECSLGQTKRHFLCVEVKTDDSAFYCGTTTGDVLAVSLKSLNLSTIAPKKNLYSRGISCVVYLKNDYILIGANDGTVALTDNSSLKRKASVKVEGKVNAIVLRGVGHQFYVSTDKCNIYKFNLGTFKYELIFTGHSTPINDIVFPKDCSRIFATCSFESIRIWDFNKRLELLRITVANMTCNCIEFSDDGSSIVSGWNDGKVRAFYPQSGNKMYTIHNAHNSQVTALCLFSKYSRVITGSNEGVIRVWSVEKRRMKNGEGYVSTLLFSLNEHKARVTCIKIRKNNEECVTSSTDGSCIIWNLETRIREYMIRLNTLFKNVCYSPDEYQILTTGDDRKVAYWETYDASNIREVEASTSGAINGLDISNSGEFFVSGGDDKILKVWNYEEGEIIQHGSLHSSPITKLKISPDDKNIVSVGSDGSILIWSKDDNQLMEKEADFTRCLTKIQDEPENCQKAIEGQNDIVKCEN